MTKIRHPLTFADAITRIAGRIGWPACVEAASSGRGKPFHERTVRNWSDPDTGTVPDLDVALRLDLAYRQSGGGESPLLAAYALRLQLDLHTPADVEERIAAASRAAKETGEGLSALIQAAQSGADEATIELARREVQEAIASMTFALKQLGGQPPPGGP